MAEATQTATIKRIWYTAEGTFGRLSCDRFSCFTLELPWRDNEPFRSCIPEGIYRVEKYSSAVVGAVLPGKDTMRIRGIPDRMNIIFHHGNTILDSQGCPMVGAGLGTIANHWAITNSVPTLSRLLTHYNFSRLTIWSHDWHPEWSEEEQEQTQ